MPNSEILFGAYMTEETLILIRLIQIEWEKQLKKLHRDFPGGPVAETLSSQCRGPGSIPGQGTRSHTTQWRLKILCAITQGSQINK